MTWFSKSRVFSVSPFDVLVTRRPTKLVNAAVPCGMVAWTAWKDKSTDRLFLGNGSQTSSLTNFHNSLGEDASPPSPESFQPKSPLYKHVNYKRGNLAFNGRFAEYATPDMHDGRSRHIAFEHNVGWRENDFCVDKYCTILSPFCLTSMNANKGSVHAKV